MCASHGTGLSYSAQFVSLTQADSPVASTSTRGTRRQSAFSLSPGNGSFHHWRGTLYRRTADLKKIGVASGIALLAALVPVAAFADDTTATSAAGVAADTVWVIVAACFVMFMQAGFAMLEVGFSRMKNVGTVVAKVITNLSVSSIAYWGVGFGLAFGAGGAFAFIGGSGFFPTFSPGSTMDLPAIAASTVPAAGKWFFEFVFCAVSLAIVWGTRLERTKFIVYSLFGVPVAALLY